MPSTMPRASMKDEQWVSTFGTATKIVSTFGTATNIGQEDENSTNTHKINTESKCGTLLEDQKNLLVRIDWV